MLFYSHSMEFCQVAREIWRTGLWNKPFESIPFLMPDALICKLGGVIYKILKFTLKNVNKDSFLPYLCSITYRKYNSLILFLTRIFCTKVCHYTLQNIVKTMFTLYGLAATTPAKLIFYQEVCALFPRFILFHGGDCC